MMSARLSELWFLTSFSMPLDRENLEMDAWMDKWSEFYKCIFYKCHK